MVVSINNTDATKDEIYTYQIKKKETYSLSLWSNVEYTEERTTATRFGRTLGCGQAAPGLWTLAVNKYTILLVHYFTTNIHFKIFKFSTRHACKTPAQIFLGLLTTKRTLGVLYIWGHMYLIPFQYNFVVVIKIPFFKHI